MIIPSGPCECNVCLYLTKVSPLDRAATEIAAEDYRKMVDKHKKRLREKKTLLERLTGYRIKIFFEKD